MTRVRQGLVIVAAVAVNAYMAAELRDVLVAVAWPSLVGLLRLYGLAS